MALYNPGFPATYQSPYLIQQPQYAQPQQQQGSLIWIQGEAAAKSYLVAPNTSVVLFDSEAQTVYIKSADASGMPSMKTLDYTIREAPNTAPAAMPKDSPAYATKDDLRAVYAQISALEARLKKEDEHE